MKIEKLTENKIRIILRPEDLEEKDLDLVKSLIKTKLDLEHASKNFEFAEGELVDYYAYQMKANQAKINYLLFCYNQSPSMITHRKLTNFISKYFFKISNRSRNTRT